MALEAQTQTVATRTAIFSAAILLFLEILKLTAFCAAAPAFRASDAQGYWNLGEQVAHADLWMVRNPVAYRTPGYPWFLGLLQVACGRHAWIVAVGAQYFSVWLTTALTAWWTMKVTGRPWLAVAALAICLMSAARPSHASTLMTETVFTLVLTLTLVSMSSLNGTNSLTVTVLRSVLWGFTVLLRPVGVTLAPAWFVAWWLLYCGQPTSSFRHRFSSVFVTAMILLVMLGPWVLRNQLLFQRTSLTVFLGRELWLTTFGPGQPVAPPLPDTAASHHLQELVLRGGDFSAWNGNWTVSNRLTAAGLSDVEADELMRVVSQEGIRLNPARTIARFVWRSIDFWRSVYSRSMTFFEDVPESELLPDDNNLRWQQNACQTFRDTWLNSAWESRLLGIELTSLLALVGLAGLWLSPHTWKFGAVLTVAILGMAALTAVVEYPSYRYRMVLEPAMIVAGLAGWNVIVDVVRRGKRSLRQEAFETV